MTNFNLVERAKGHGPAIEQGELLDLLAELDAWRGIGDTPEELAERPLCMDEDHADYDDLERFFRDCETILCKTSAWKSTATNAKNMSEELEIMDSALDDWQRLAQRRNVKSADEMKAHLCELEWQIEDLAAELRRLESL